MGVAAEAGDKAALPAAVGNRLKSSGSDDSVQKRRLPSI